MKGAFIFVLLVASCAAPQPDSTEAGIAVGVLPELRTVPALLRPLASDYGAGGALLQGAVAYDLGDPTYAATRLEVARRMADAPPSATALHAWVLFDAADAEAAQSVAMEGLSSYPYSAAIRAVLAEALLRQGLVAEAAEELRAIPSEAASEGFVLSLRARVAYSEQRFQESLRALDLLVLNGPLDPRMVRLRAQTLEALGHAGDAVPLYEQLAAAAESDPLLLEEMAFAVLRAASASGDVPLFARAEFLLRRVTALDPQHARAHAGIGNCAGARGEVELAQAAWNRALELNPADVDTALALATSLHADGQKEEALRLLQDIQRQPMSGDAHRRVQAAQRKLTVTDEETEA